MSELKFSLCINFFDLQGDLSKGGKGGRVLNGEKSAVPKPPAPLELRIEQGRYLANYLCFPFLCGFL